MSRSRSVCPALALILAALLAWPWGLALSATESSQVALQSNHGTWVAHSSRARQFSRSGKWCQTLCPAVSPDFDESEDGDPASPSQTAALPPFHAHFTTELVLQGWSVDVLGPRKPTPIGILCRLRC
ncbi:MAG: hypothetical protein P4L84_35205 [Isosphaeraceae bacterium]|nr:hypothetical protein [Isosphaeraceae bacterium]